MEHIHGIFLSGVDTGWKGKRSLVLNQKGNFGRVTVFMNFRLLINETIHGRLSRQYYSTNTLQRFCCTAIQLPHALCFIQNRSNTRLTLHHENKNNCCQICPNMIWSLNSKRRRLEQDLWTLNLPPDYSAWQHPLRAMDCRLFGENKKI